MSADPQQLCYRLDLLLLQLLIGRPRRLLPPLPSAVAEYLNNKSKPNLANPSSSAIAWTPFQQFIARRRLLVVVLLLPFGVATLSENGPSFAWYTGNGCVHSVSSTPTYTASSVRAQRKTHVQCFNASWGCATPCRRPESSVNGIWRSRLSLIHI